MKRLYNPKTAVWELLKTNDRFVIKISGPKFLSLQRQMDFLNV